MCPAAARRGGLGAGLMAFLDATLHRGVDLVIEAVGLADKVKSADLVITGEGSVDGQTVYGKTPVGVARVAKSFNKPVVAVAGTIGAGARRSMGTELTWSWGFWRGRPLWTRPWPGQSTIWRRRGSGWVVY